MPVQTAKIVPQELSGSFRITGLPTEGYATEEGYKSETFEFAGSNWFVRWFPEGCPSNWPDASDNFASYFLYQEEDSSRQMAIKQTVQLCTGGRSGPKKRRDDLVTLASSNQGMGWAKFIHFSKIEGHEVVSLELQISARKGNWKPRKKRKITMADIQELSPDTTLRGRDGVEVKVHRVVLSVHSPVFRARFEKRRRDPGGKKRRRPSISISTGLDYVEISGFDGEDLQRMVTYFYEGRIDLGPWDTQTSKGYASLLRLAKKFQTDDLDSAIINKAMQGLDLGTPFSFHLYKRLMALSVQLSNKTLHNCLLVNVTKGLCMGNLQGRLRTLLENRDFGTSPEKAIQNILGWLCKQGKPAIVSEMSEFLMKIKEMKPRFVEEKPEELNQIQNVEVEAEIAG